jgi:hypothetical protein
MIMSLRLHKNCIFVQVDEKAVVFRHTPHDGHNIYHYTPEDEPARVMLNLLAKGAASAQKIEKSDLVTELKRVFQVTDQQAQEAVEEFLNDLRGLVLLEEPEHVAHNPSFQRHTGKHVGHIRAGGTMISVGYTINWYRP